MRRRSSFSKTKPSSSFHPLTSDLSILNQAGMPSIDIDPDREQRIVELVKDRKTGFFYAVMNDCSIYKGRIVEPGVMEWERRGELPCNGSNLGQELLVKATPNGDSLLITFPNEGGPKTVRASGLCEGAFRSGVSFGDDLFTTTDPAKPPGAALGGVPSLKGPAGYQHVDIRGGSGSFFDSASGLAQLQVGGDKRPPAHPGPVDPGGGSRAMQPAYPESGRRWLRRLATGL